jgi:hypothetical protein
VKERIYIWLIQLKKNSSEIKAIIEVSKILEPIHKSNRSRKETNWTCKFTTYI